MQWFFWAVVVVAVVSFLLWLWLGDDVPESIRDQIRNKEGGGK